MVATGPSHSNGGSMGSPGGSLLQPDCGPGGHTAPPWPDRDRAEKSVPWEVTVLHSLGGDSAQPHSSPAETGKNITEMITVSGGFPTSRCRVLPWRLHKLREPLGSESRSSQELRLRRYLRKQNLLSHSFSLSSPPPPSVPCN